LNLIDKKIVVVGGLGRIGRELCVRLVQEGAIICIADLEKGEWEEFSKSRLTHQQQKNAEFVKVDSTDTVSVRALVTKCENRFSSIDGVVNCSYPRAAGFNKSIEELSFEEFTENLKVHLGSYFLITKEFALAMKKHSRGSIVNFSSIYGIMAPRFELYEGTDMRSPISYAAIKAGIVHTSRYFAKYLKGTGIRVNCVSPGGILDKQPQVFLDRYAERSLSKGMLDSEDILGTVVFLLSEQSKYINGQNLIVDDGFSL
jgi:NAD(P)-dependent dehydrogenase (short-subunit alcohol dehydrogenase family)